MNTSIEMDFRTILLNHNKKDFKYLLAVSGGVDSMVLLDMFRKTSTNFQVAHCNFQLRGDDSLGDEKFVREYCGKHTIPFHSVKFDVENFKSTGNYSTEMACRILRYNWFEEIMQTNKLDFLVTAHHLNDNIETFIINLSRGTGLKGLVGMKISAENIFRPLLSTTKENILHYANSEGLSWREDYTNQTDEYIRNKIRHHIAPVLNEIHPNFETNFNKTLSFINDAQSFIESQMENIRKRIIYDEEQSAIEIETLNSLDNMNFVQYYLFERYGFKDVDLINKLKCSENSSELTSQYYRLIKNRDFLILSKKSIEETDEIIIKQDEIKIKSLNLKFIRSNSKLENATECINADNIKFPLRFRKVKVGDYFFPLGMQGQKKMISKFFKDLKLSKIEKENAWLLVDNLDQIIWVVNYRLDERFKMKENIKNYLNIIVC